MNTATDYFTAFGVAVTAFAMTLALAHEVATGLVPPVL